MLRVLVLTVLSREILWFFYVLKFGSHIVRKQFGASFNDKSKVNGVRYHLSGV
jgi:hypothetical protein